MGTYYTDNFAKAERKSRKRKAGIIGAALAAVATFGSVAWAVMAVQSNEASAKVEAGTAQELKLSDAKPSGKLFPGMSVDVEFNVKNPNPFPVTLTSIVAGSGTPTVSCAGGPSDIAKLSSSLLVTGSTVQLPAPVVIEANGEADVKLPKAVKLAPSASGGCTLEGKFKVTGSGAGSGN